LLGGDLMEQSILGWLGKFDIEIVNEKGEVIRRDSFKNLITNGALNTLRDVLEGSATDIEIKYFALGTDDGTTLPLDANNTSLGSEQFRKLVTKQTKPSTGVLESTVNINATEAVFNIREIGVFGGSSATSTLNSGTMIARVFYTLDKTNLESVNIVRTDTIGRA
jgi:hypothetical protein